MGEDTPPADANKDGAPGADGKKGSSAFTKMMLKVVTVMVYMSAVSGAGFLLSLYYIIFWNPNIQGVRPPGYLRSGRMVGQPQALVDPIMPQALRSEEPVPAEYLLQRKMSREFMHEYFNNLTGGQGEARIPGENVMDSQPTPKVLPLMQEGYHHSAHQIHPGQFTSTQSLSNDNAQSPGPSPQQGLERDMSPTGTPHVSEELRHQHQHQQQHGHPPISTSA